MLLESTKNIIRFNTLDRIKNMAEEIGNGDVGIFEDNHDLN